MNKILITGGAGFVGSALIELLLNEGYYVRVIDNLRYGGQSLANFFKNQNFEFIKGDVRSKSDMEKAVEGVDFVIHLAAVVGYPACKQDPELSHDINVNGTQNIVNILNGKIPLIYSSTGSNYGKMVDQVCLETSALNPLSEYGKQKTMAEDVVKTNKKFVIFRFATGFGISPRLRLDLLPNDFTFRAVKDKNLIVYEKNYMRTFIHVRDMAKAFLFAIENYSKLKGEIYNVGDNSMNFSKEAICLLIKKKVDYYLHFADIGHDLDQRDYVVSYDKINAAGFKTTISMEEGINELVKVSQVIEVKNPYNNLV